MNQPYWVSETVWACPRHIPSARIPAGQEACLYVPCRSQRPPKPEPVKTPVVVVDNGPSEAEKRRGATTKTTCAHCGALLWRRKNEVGPDKVSFCNREHRAAFQVAA